MPLANRAAEAAAVRRRLAGGGTILVVGGRSSNFDPALRAHPRVHFWDSTDAKSETREMPENVRVIICTRFLTHNMFARVHRYATKRQLLMLPGLNSTGEIKDVIQMALDLPPQTPPSPTPPPPMPNVPVPTDTPTDAEPDDDDETPSTAPRVQGGNYRPFLQAHANLDASTASEARRLLPLVTAAGFSPTLNALTQMLYVLRRERDGLPSTVRSKPQPAPAAAPPTSNIAEALRLIDDAATVLGLVREAVLKVQSDDHALKTTMAALRGFLNEGSRP